MRPGAGFSARVAALGACALALMACLIQPSEGQSPAATTAAVQPTTAAIPATRIPANAATSAPAATTASTPAAGDSPERAPTTGVLPRTYTIDAEAAARLQATVDAAQQPWRLDPVQVAGMTLEAEGITSTQAQFTRSELAPEPGTGRPRTLVRAATPTGAYEIDVVQPVRQGQGGVWVATALRRAS